MVFLVVERLTLTPEPWRADRIVITMFCLLAALFVVLGHHANLRRLWQGNENQLKENPAMYSLSKALHVLALGICLGAEVFFIILGLVLFPTFADLSKPGKDKREAWFPLPEQYGKPLPPEAAKVLGKGQFDDARLEQGSRAAGAVVTPLFVWYYGLQTGCVLLALACAWSWPKDRVQRIRVSLLVAAVVFLGIGWWLDVVVHDLRGPRNEKTDAVLRSPAPNVGRDQGHGASPSRVRDVAWLQPAAELRHHAGRGRGAGPGSAAAGAMCSIRTDAIAARPCLPELPATVAGMVQSKVTLAGH